MLELNIHRHVRILLSNPHYPENVGAACRALKTMGFTRIGLVRPSKLALPSHPMARKMAVKSLDVLDGAELFDNLDEAIVGSDVVVGTTGRRGVSGVFPPWTIAEKVVDWTRAHKRVSIVFGNEKTGLTNEELARCDAFLRVPMAALQPSLNLAQAVQVCVYELFAKALADRDGPDAVDAADEDEETESGGLVR